MIYQAFVIGLIFILIESKLLWNPVERNQDWYVPTNNLSSIVDLESTVSFACAYNSFGLSWKFNELYSPQNIELVNTMLNSPTANTIPIGSLYPKNRLNNENRLTCSGTDDIFCYPKIKTVKLLADENRAMIEFEEPIHKIDIIDYQTVFVIEPIPQNHPMVRWVNNVTLAIFFDEEDMIAFVKAYNAGETVKLKLQEFTIPFELIAQGEKIFRMDIPGKYQLFFRSVLSNERISNLLNLQIDECEDLGVIPPPPKILPSIEQMKQEKRISFALHGILPLTGYDPIKVTSKISPAMVSEKYCYISFFAAYYYDYLRKKEHGH
jgi:hypothetical protein